MSSSFLIDFLSGGLMQGSGLSLTTGGLLVIRDVPGTVPGADGPRAITVDVKLRFSTEEMCADLVLEQGDLAIENGLESALLLSLFTDRRCSDEELERFGGTDARGWWGDSLSEITGDQYGSRLWLLQRETQTAESLARAKAYAEEALGWLLEDGICDEVLVTALYPRDRVLGLVVELVRARAPRERFAFVWEP